ncbi:MAG: hypothetical protein J6V99_07520 [Neisseriaceae bacterium]|nr:hypothetical protein [Neisseriaceae bacterium]
MIFQSLFPKSVIAMLSSLCLLSGCDWVMSQANAVNTNIPQQIVKPSSPTQNTHPKQQEVLLQAQKLMDGYFYDEALSLLDSVENTTEIQNLRQKCQTLKNALVRYEGRHYHVFFHSLIVDTSKAFDGDFMQQGYNMYMTTVSEFQKMLPLFLEQGFILYDIADMVEFKDGQAIPKDIYLPEGKKPLIISIDDVNYYEYMKTDGFANRLDVDDAGNVVTIIKDENGQEKITYDGDVMPILDDFVKRHPEFSWRGAKGIVAVTGYEGAFGYRITDHDKYSEDEINQMRHQVKKVADALRQTGWKMANHSYTHNRYWANKTMTMNQLAYDINKWQTEIAPYVGKTNIIITPFGVSYDPRDPRFRYIVDNGFNIYCPVGSDMSVTVEKDYMLFSRLNLDGITMMAYPQRMSRHFFEPELVLDAERPPLVLQKMVQKKKSSGFKSQEAIPEEFLMPLNPVLSQKSEISAEQFPSVQHHAEEHSSSQAPQEDVQLTVTEQTEPPKTEHQTPTVQEIIKEFVEE